MYLQQMAMVTTSGSTTRPDHAGANLLMSTASAGKAALSLHVTVELCSSRHQSPLTELGALDHAAADQLAVHM